MYQPDKELIMDTNKLKKVTQSAILNNLLYYHSEFQEYLDVISARNLDNNIIDILIQIRQFNIDCITKYTDLIARGDMKFKPTPNDLYVRNNRIYNDQMALTKINTKLSMLLPSYIRALSNRSLNGFARMIVGNNYERIVNIKDNLLHPLPELHTV